MAIILDADVIIRGEKGAFDLQRWVAARPDEQFEVAAITVAELWHGVERATGSASAEAPAISANGSGLVAGHPLYGTDRLRTCPHLGGIGSGRQDDWLLRPHRGGNGFGTRQRSGHVQPAAFCPSEGADRHCAEMKGRNSLPPSEGVEALKRVAASRFNA